MSVRCLIRNCRWYELCLSETVEELQASSMACQLKTNSEADNRGECFRCMRVPCCFNSFTTGWDTKGVVVILICMYVADAKRTVLRGARNWSEKTFVNSLGKITNVITVPGLRLSTADGNTFHIPFGRQ